MSNPLLPFAKQMRTEPTEAEAKLWLHLRAGRLAQYKFKRQQPIGPYIADFVCFKQKLIVEVDGSQHMDRADYDANRTQWLESQGFHVQRFWNNAVLNETDAVLDSILLALE